MRGLSPVVASGGHSSSRCAGLSVSWPLFLRSTGSSRAGSAAVAHGPSCSAACGIFPAQGSNPCPLHWQADSQPLHHQGSPQSYVLMSDFLILLSIHTELHRKFLCNFWIRKFNNMNEDLSTPPPISTDYFIDFMLFPGSPFSMARMWNC